MLDQAGKPGVPGRAVNAGMLMLIIVRPGKLHAGFQHGDGGQRVQLAQFKKDMFEADELL